MNIYHSKTLTDRADWVLDNKGSNIYDIRVVLYNPKSDLRIELKYIDSFKIKQNFVETYFDHINLKADIPVIEYVRLTKDVVDLHGYVEFRSVDPETLQVGDVVTKVDRRIIIKNREDLLKTVPRGLLEPTEDNPINEAHISNTITLNIDFIDPMIYQIRKKRQTMLLRDVTIEQTLKIIGVAFGFKNIYVHKPDNTKVYKNMLIPPMKDIADIFNFMQHNSAYGVYEKGMSYYAVDGNLYIFPVYEHEPPAGESVVHIYDMGKDSYMGLYKYHNFKDNDIHIVSTTGSKNKNYAETRIENHGNSYHVLDPNKSFNDWMEIGQYKALVSGKLESILSPVNGLSENTYTPQFRCNNNSYIYKEDVYSNIINTVNIGWVNAVPFQIKPFNRVMYHHDDQNDNFRSIIGTCTSVTYECTSVQSLGRKVYAMTAGLELLIAPDLPK